MLLFRQLSIGQMGLRARGEGVGHRGCGKDGRRRQGVARDTFFGVLCSGIIH